MNPRSIPLSLAWLSPFAAGCALVAGIETFESSPPSGAVDGSVAADAPADSPTIDGALDGSVDGPFDGATDAPPPVSCVGAAQGAPADPNDPWARCCNGQRVRVVDDANCGACGIACSTDRKQKCTLKGGAYYCAGCATDFATASGCWSNCCSVTFFSEGVCVPNTCGSPSSCIESLCNSFGATCHVPANASSYCGYDAPK